MKPVHSGQASAGLRRYIETQHQTEISVPSEFRLGRSCSARRDYVLRWYEDDQSAHAEGQGWHGPDHVRGRSGYPESHAVERWGDGETYGCCLVVNDTMEPHIPAFFCGYVRFKHAPLREPGLWAQVARVEVHGGITYAEIDPDGSGVYGFDCCHFGDHANPTCQNRDWLKAETEDMRVQIAEIGAQIRTQEEPNR
jgi:hypothetical protein